MKIFELKDIDKVNQVVEVHMKSFSGFFLTFLGKGFLMQLYTGFVRHESSGLLVAVDNQNKIVGFLAYSDDLSGFYKYLIKTRLISFAWYSICAFIKNPKIMFRLLRAFTYSSEAKRDEKYIELSSIGVLPEVEGLGIGSKLIITLKNKIDFSKYEYIKLETDAVNNESVNNFYKKNGFILDHEYKTNEGRRMNEYRSKL
ncbi:GNAT family N-acetyltransferase [Clostridium perfringens]|uniref:GNAT family N-acetyltransferase n=1 Tax=Clostridium perfringens TaxID=1502 RepID=UPI0018E49D62|nr:GNAT family N-acetyltransferase [Clostridium perfringens]ELC8413682.1 GNAT family N-acetyltransferase [Clostridium perfringens]MBI6007233.1 GNAT family N-acetyltransferase [Clostridium perfringens]MDM0605562.1 GNAT family N-acetyltransferase [Clostridium perfringens]MDM0638776.1 GNAT family N-acetyltransferase [Clostridium perfringens]HAT4166202.1 GNAT family N-acetyltransferase [Clostridium perfringens]